MADIRVRSINPFHRRDFLSRVFQEMCEGGLPDGTFPIGKSLSWQGFRAAASRADLAAVCVQALDFREPHTRPDRKLYAAFRLSLGTALLDKDLPFTRPQLCVLGEALIMQIRAENDAFPVERLTRIIRRRARAHQAELNAANG